MSLAAHTLRQVHIRIMSEIMIEIGKHKKLRPKVQKPIQPMETELNLPSKNDPAWYRIFHGNMPSDHIFNAVAFDYLCGELNEDGENWGISIQSEGNIAAHIKKLKFEMRRQITSSSNPFWAILNEAEDFEHDPEVPRELIQEYIGYRRESEQGDLVKFYLRVFYDKKSKNTKKRVYFMNRYSRNEQNWVLNGIGNFAKETLYLFGLARSREKNGVSV